ncbi:MAG: alpha/beta hydrolase [Eubacteriales bacterium]|nr:alpha/beta hydrolase [Eubacteriales bacterium]
MPSTISNVLQAAIRGFRPVLNNLSLEMERAGQDVIAAGEMQHLPENMVVAPVTIGAVPAEWFHPMEAPEDEAVIYFHGGAYMAGSLISNRPLAVDFARATQRNVLSFEYRLAPEHPYPAGLDDAMEVYRYALGIGLEPSRIAFVGDSAGGGLELACTLRSKSEGLPMPACIVALSPWTDLTLRGESHTNKASVDPLLERNKLLRAVMYYAYGKDLTDPLISPLYGSFQGFPPTLIHVGTHELLLSDSQNIAKAMQQQGVDVLLEEWENMWHVWHVFDVPESRKAMEHISDYILTHINADDTEELSC